MPGIYFHGRIIRNTVVLAAELNLRFFSTYFIYTFTEL